MTVSVQFFMLEVPLKMLEITILRRFLNDFNCRLRPEKYCEVCLCLNSFVIPARMRLFIRSDLC